MRQGKINIVQIGIVLVVILERGREQGVDRAPDQCVVILSLKGCLLGRKQLCLLLLNESEIQACIVLVQVLRINQACGFVMTRSLHVLTVHILFLGINLGPDPVSWR